MVSFGLVTSAVMDGVSEIRSPARAAAEFHENLINKPRALPPYAAF